MIHLKPSWWPELFYWVIIALDMLCCKHNTIFLDYFITDIVYLSLRAHKHLHILIKKKQKNKLWQLRLNVKWRKHLFKWNTFYLHRWANIFRVFLNNRNLKNLVFQSFVPFRKRSNYLQLRAKELLKETKCQKMSVQHFHLARNFGILD